MMGAN
jgi:hypothetical protein